MKTEMIKDLKRKDLGEKFYKMGFKEGVEVGVCTGKNSEALCKGNPDLHLTGVDPYDTVELRSSRIGAEGQEALYQEAIKRLKPYKFEMIRKSSMEAVLSFPYESLDFVYIDGGHEFDYVICDIIEWGKRVKKGGIISGHDYYRFINGGVILAVDTYCAIHKVETLYLTDDGRDKRSSWWFIKTW